MKNLESLKNLGLNEKEQIVYIALLQLEKATANQIARKSGIKRPTSYDILYRLQTDGFIYEANENGKRFFVANPPEQLVQRLDERKKALEADLPFLLSIYNIKAKRPKVAYFEGLDGIKKLYEDTLKSLKSSDEILAYVTTDSLEILADFSADYVARRVEKGIRLRGIYNTSIKMSKYLHNNQKQLREARVVKKFPLKNEINIYANKIIILTYSPEPFGVLIESNEIAETQRAIFELAWIGAKEVGK